jgi:hypothetical protein
MEEQEFHEFLKRGGRSESAARRVIARVREFEAYLQEYADTGLDQANGDHLEAFVACIEQDPGTSAKGHLWGIRYYYAYTSNQEMQDLAAIFREQRIQRKPFALKGFRGVSPEHLDTLAALGIRDVKQMLGVGQTGSERTTLTEETGIPLEVIVELVKLSDLARLSGVKGIRARLYLDAGVDTVDAMAEWDPEDLRAMLADFVERTGFDGIAPLPMEARSTVTQARNLPKVVES